eukprot:1195592-Prorocentrum_minimum.AAC.7
MEGSLSPRQDERRRGESARMSGGNPNRHPDRGRHASDILEEAERRVKGDRKETACLQPSLRLTGGYT